MKINKNDKYSDEGNNSFDQNSKCNHCITKVINPITTIFTNNNSKDDHVQIKTMNFSSKYSNF